MPLPAMLLLVAAAPEPAVAHQEPLFARVMSFRLPADMVRVTDRNNGTNILIEFVPKGQTVANWTRMVTIQAYRGLGASPMPTSAIARQAFYPAACRNGPIYRDFGELPIAPGVKRTLVAIGCAALPAGAYPHAMKGAGEQDFIMIFRDAETTYTLNYAERGAPFVNKAPPRDIARTADFLAAQFGEVRLTLR